MDKATGQASPLAGERFSLSLVDLQDTLSNL